MFDISVYISINSKFLIWFVSAKSVEFILLLRRTSQIPCNASKWGGKLEAWEYSWIFNLYRAKLGEINETKMPFMLTIIIDKC